MPISGDLKSWDFFRTRTPPPPTGFANATHPEKFFLIRTLYPLPPRPPPINFEGKTWIYLSGTSNKKFIFFFCLQRTKCITQENEARNRNTSIRSQMILKFWNKRRLNCSFLWATDPNFLLSESFGHPCGRAGDSRTILESWHICKLPWWNRWLHTIVLLCIYNSSIRCL